MCHAVGTAPHRGPARLLSRQPRQLSASWIEIEYCKDARPGQHLEAECGSMQTFAGILVGKL
eukprot:1148015-Pelagomonas_calceolata.AAC.2